MDIVQHITTAVLCGAGSGFATFIVTLLILALSPLPPPVVMLRQKRRVIRWSVRVGVVVALAWLAFVTP
jgi:hypothetical protein